MISYVSLPDGISFNVFAMWHEAGQINHKPSTTIQERSSRCFLLETTETTIPQGDSRWRRLVHIQPLVTLVSLSGCGFN